MRVEYINPFSEAAYVVLSEVLAGETKRGGLVFEVYVHAGDGCCGYRWPCRGCRGACGI